MAYFGKEITQETMFLRYFHYSGMNNQASRHAAKKFPPQKH